MAGSSGRSAFARYCTPTQESIAGRSSGHRAHRLPPARAMFAAALVFRARLWPDPAMRRFEFKDARSYKFWEIQVEGNAFTVRYGKVGTDGVTQTKSYANADKAKAEAEK
ncbi:MAG: WGR domain-containing protein, partial [Myxococcales bacterium]|nr:WGR domain-containing protein [Myxococcales bacterium]